MLHQSTNDLWDLEKPIITERSHLNHLKPIGVGTTMVESLTGYIARLADSHNVFPGILISREIAPFLKEIFLKDSSSRGLRAFFHRATALNGTGVMALDFVNSLENLTSQSNLCFLTLLYWAEIIPPRGLFNSHKTWCSACYEHWYLSGEIVYEPLIWNLSNFKVCPYHHQRLQNICPHCQDVIPLLTWRTRPGYCSNCGGWLGRNDSKTSTDEFSQQGFLSKEELEWQTWVAEVLGELIAAIPYLKTPIPKENIAKSLSIAIDMVSEGNLAAFASLLGLPKNTVWMWKNGKAVPQIDLMLRICYFLRVTLLNFLTSEDIASCIKITIKPPYQRSRKPRISPKSFDSEQVQNALLAVVRSDEIPPPAMREVALQLGYDRRTILQHFPNLCHAISAKRLSYCKSLRLENIELSRKEVQQIAIRLCNEGIYPTENLVSQSMTKPGYLRYKEVRATLQQAQTNFSG
ncbi:MAG: TniQ family protein [Nostoc sp.]|uniref:TniQ family protein n=1 Tax=Nostoc sp. TaxID=1180 RepID=UPI002FF77710